MAVSETCQKAAPIQLRVEVHHLHLAKMVYLNSQLSWPVPPRTLTQWAPSLKRSRDPCLKGPQICVLSDMFPINIVNQSLLVNDQFRRVFTLEAHLDRHVWNWMKFDALQQARSSSFIQFRYDFTLRTT
eukprot:gene4729-biopygen12769